MLTAPPNRYTNTTISMTGSISAVSRASGLRADRRRLRPAMIRASHIDGLLSVSGEGEENVVQRGAVDGEAGDQVAARVGRVEDGPDLGGVAFGGHARGQAPVVLVDYPGPEVADQLLVGGPAGAGDVEALGGDLALELGRGALGDDRARVQDGDPVGQPFGLFQVLGRFAG